MYSTPLTAVAFFISFEKKLGKSLALSQKLHTFANAITKVMHFGSLAQLNRASDYGSEGCGFESRGSHSQGCVFQHILFFFPLDNMDFRTLQWAKINAEFSLQSASQNSRENNQRQSWSQIREFWAMFVSCCYLEYYKYIISLLFDFYHFSAAKALR